MPFVRGRTYPSPVGSAVHDVKERPKFEGCRILQAFLVSFIHNHLEEVISFKTIFSIGNHFLPYLWANKGVVVILERGVMNVANPVNRN